MAWYAYCIAEQKAFLNGTRARRPFSISSITGIAGTQVFGYPSGEFAVIVSNYTEGTLDQKAALDHARVVGECFRTSTVLPFRFGTVFQTEDAIRRAVRMNRKALVDSVNHLRGKAEMHLKLVVRDGVAKETIHAIAATIGGAYLTQIRERAAIQRDRQSKAKSLSVQVHRLFNPLDEEVSCKKVEAGGLLIDIAHLIDNTSVEKYQNRYVAAARQLKDCQIALSGPWPPYHFMPGKLKSAGNS